MILAECTHARTHARFLLRLKKGNLHSLSLFCVHAHFKGTLGQKEGGRTTITIFAVAKNALSLARTRARTHAHARISLRFPSEAP